MSAAFLLSNGKRLPASSKPHQAVSRSPSYINYKTTNRDSSRQKQDRLTETKQAHENKYLLQHGFGLDGWIVRPEILELIYVLLELKQLLL